MSKAISFATVLSLALLWTLPGCGDDHGDHDAPGHHNTPGDHDDGEHHDKDAKLSPEDKALADAQKTCPVTGEALDSMGGPIKVMHEGRAVFLCCSGCVKEFRADPEKFIKKLSR